MSIVAFPYPRFKIGKSEYKWSHCPEHGLLYVATRQSDYAATQTGTLLIESSGTDEVPPANCLLDLTDADPRKEMPPIYFPDENGCFEYQLTDQEERILYLVYADGGMEVTVNQPDPDDVSDI